MTNFYFVHTQARSTKTLSWIKKKITPIWNALTQNIGASPPPPLLKELHDDVIAAPGLSESLVQGQTAAPRNALICVICVVHNSHSVYLPSCFQFTWRIVINTQVRLQSDRHKCTCTTGEHEKQKKSKFRSKRGNKTKTHDWKAVWRKSGVLSILLEKKLMKRLSPRIKINISNLTSAHSVYSRLIRFL